MDNEPALISTELFMLSDSSLSSNQRYPCCLKTSEKKVGSAHHHLPNVTRAVTSCSPGQSQPNLPLPLPFPSPPLSAPPVDRMAMSAGPSFSLTAEASEPPPTPMVEPKIERKRKKSITSLEAFDSDDDDDPQSKSTGHLSSHELSDLETRHPGMSPTTRQNHSEIEKRRRDKMNTYITELSALIPMCSAMNRKLDKLTVLRMAVQHINSLKGSSKVCSEVSEKPSYISDDELKKVILNVADGFLFVVGCDRGRILYVSDSVKNILHYSQSDLIGQSLLDILHPRDISKVKEQLSSSDLTPRERLIDAKTMLPVKTEYPPKPTHLCSGARRSFFCHMKSAGKVSADLAASMKVKKELMETTYHRKRKSEQKNYKVIHCTGYLKSWSKAKIGMVEDGEADDCSILNCLVAVGREQPTFNPYLAEDSSHIKVRSLEYMSRHNIDGKFTYVDERATVILGYLPQELLGTSVYEYYHQDDILALGQIHRKVLSSKEKLETDVFRFKLKNGKFLHLRSKIFGFRNPWTKEVEYIVSTNTVVQMQEVTSSGQMFDPSVFLPDDNDLQAMDMLSPGSSSRPPAAPPAVPEMFRTATLVGAARIGKQIANECVEQVNKSCPPADSSNLGSQNAAQNHPPSSGTTTASSFGTAPPSVAAPAQLSPTAPNTPSSMLPPPPPPPPLHGSNMTDLRFPINNGGLNAKGATTTTTNTTSPTNSNTILSNCMGDSDLNSANTIIDIDLVVGDLKAHGADNFIHDSSNSNITSNINNNNNNNNSNNANSANNINRNIHNNNNNNNRNNNNNNGSNCLMSNSQSPEWPSALVALPNGPGFELETFDGKARSDLRAAALTMVAINAILYD
ncbi:Aryl-hydrocarbon receptor nuclear translocator-like [Plakobranchus ocellatus]|uniref:Aryl-hydrocarbon receptor nuclear translocator-like n=1 Tax=Plakobranchus ocellatus TaxID=259542 RepID=A0AAV3YYF0_9GAST|nr:Aryl-hydrocarbon receptor nuclear translocator-like [Plakobranchus ocellatus]